MRSEVIRKIQRGLRKPPGYIARRLLAEGFTQSERYFGVRRGERFDVDSLLKETGDQTLESLWQRLSETPYLSTFDCFDEVTYERLCSGDSARIFSAAERALRHQVDLIGSGVVELGDKIDWHKDYKTGFR